MVIVLWRIKQNPKSRVCNVGTSIVYIVVREGLPNLMAFRQRRERRQGVKREFQTDFYLEIWLNFYRDQYRDQFFQILVAQPRLC